MKAADGAGGLLDLVELIEGGLESEVDLGELFLTQISEEVELEPVGLFGITVVAFHLLLVVQEVELPQSFLRASVALLKLGFYSYRMRWRSVWSGRTGRTGRRPSKLCSAAGRAAKPSASFYYVELKIQ